MGCGMIPTDAGKPFSWEGRRLWSLRDMLNKYAWWFFTLAEFLTQLNRELDLSPPDIFTPPTGLAGFGLSTIGIGLGGNLLSPDNIGNALAIPAVAMSSPPPNTLSEG